MPYKDPQARREYQRRYREIQKDKNRQYAKKPRQQQRMKDLATKTPAPTKGEQHEQEIRSEGKVQGNDCQEERQEERHR